MILLNIDSSLKNLNRESESMYTSDCNRCPRITCWSVSRVPYSSYVRLKLLIRVSELFIPDYDWCLCNLQLALAWVSFCFYHQSQSYQRNSEFTGIHNHTNLPSVGVQVQLLKRQYETRKSWYRLKPITIDFNVIHRLHEQKSVFTYDRIQYIVIRQNSKFTTDQNRSW